MHWHRRAPRALFSLRTALSAVGLGVVVVAAGGCGLSTKESGGAADAIKKPELLCARAGAERVEASSFRGDGKNDIFKVFVRGPEAGGGVVLSCKELDLNGDGRKDMLVYYDSRGRKLREEFDHDFDGLADMKSYYEGGQLVRQELDVDFDGKPDLVEYIEGGKRVRLEKIAAPPPATPGKTEAAGAAASADPAAPGFGNSAPGAAAGSPRSAGPGPSGAGGAAPSTTTSGASDGASGAAAPGSGGNLQAPSYPVAPPAQ